MGKFLKPSRESKKIILIILFSGISDRPPSSATSLHPQYPPKFDRSATSGGEYERALIEISLLRQLVCRFSSRLSPLLSFFHCPRIPLMLRSILSSVQHSHFNKSYKYGNQTITLAVNIPLKCHKIVKTI